jgi:SAM-dependent methyltransferase
MGVTAADISFLLAARGLGASFERTLTIGRQWLFSDAAGLVDAYLAAGQNLDRETAVRLVSDGAGFAEPVFRHVGAREIQSLDASAYEGSSVVQDLNEPLQEHLHRRYDLVFDGGTLEHVFNVPQALKNCMEAVRPGGHFITVTPGNSFLGHGFYQFSPELHYRVLSPENGFEVIVVLARSDHRWGRWYAVADPSAVRDRVRMSGPSPTLLYVLAKRISDVRPFATWPQQSDYRTVWSGEALAQSTMLRKRIVSRLPVSIRRSIDELRSATALTGRKSDASHFRRVEIADIARGSRGRD